MFKKILKGLEVAEIRELIRQKGLKQKDVAELTGYTKEHVSRVLNGKSELSIDFVNKIKAIAGLKEETGPTPKDMKTELTEMLEDMRAQTEYYRQINERLEKEIEKKDATIDRLLGLLEQNTKEK